MNYHSDEWIMEKLFEHKQEAETIIPKEHIVGIFIQGSQNYGLDYEGSDIDTKCITTPTFKDIALARKPISTTHIRTNDEHIDLKDIRLYVQTFRKQNLNFLEILFTKYYYINPTYASFWDKLVQNREAIAHYNEIRSIKSMMGVASEKYFAMEHHYPSRMPWIEKFGYDPKQLHHLLRVSEFLEKYIAGEKYLDCLTVNSPEFLKEVKLGYYNLENARTVADNIYNLIHSLCDEFIATHDEKINPVIEALFDEVSYEIMKQSVELELN